MKTKNEKNPIKEEQQDEKAGAVDQIKKKYGFSKPVSIHLMQRSMIFLLQVIVVEVVEFL